MVKWAEAIIDEIIRAKLIHDFDFISIAPSDEIFIKMANMFLKKWNEICRQEGTEDMVGRVLLHIKEYWLGDRLRYWYSGASRGRVVNNSGLEGINGCVKAEVTEFKQLLMLEFLQRSMDFFENESKRRNPDDVNFVGVAIVEPDLSRTILERGYQLSIKTGHFANVKKLVDGTDVDVFVCLKLSNIVNSRRPTSDGAMRIASRFLGTDGGNWSTFDECVTTYTEARLLQMNVSKERDPGNWRGFTCTCRTFAKEFVCEDVVGQAEKISPFISSDCKVIGN